MYGIILDSMMDCIKQVYGEKIWQSIIGSRDISSTVFTTHRIYDEQLVATIVKAASELTGFSVNTIMEAAGEHFIEYINEIRNDSITKVLGRTFKDFLNGLNCMHEYYRFSFTEMQPPSFLVSKEDVYGLELQYRSRRTFSGLTQYVKGLLKKIATKFYDIDLDIEITQHGFTGDIMLAVYRLNYPNNEYKQFRELLAKKQNFHTSNNLTLDSDGLFDLFPFHVAFNDKLQIMSTGLGLEAIQSGLEGRRLNETFFMTRPLGYELTWNNILINRNNVFELTSAKSSGRPNDQNDTSRFRDQMTATHFIKLRGRMLHVEQGDYVLFIATLMIDDLNNMYDMGIFVNDLPLHDLSRDMVLHGPQDTTEYKLALNLEQGKAARLEEMVENLSFEQRKSDDLLYCMIPKEIANALRQGYSEEKLCRVYDDVTILFSDVVNFDNICQHIAPHEVMIILNMMVNVFDLLCDQFSTYKVETVADGFMCVSGAPNYNKRHAHNMADMAIEMLRGIKTVRDPNTREPIQIRIGLHCGGVVAGLVGHKIPQYCLFGDTVNIASKMEATGSGQRIQISQTCRDKLIISDEYSIEDKGVVDIKGNDRIMTYWLNGKKSAASTDSNLTSFSSNKREVSESDNEQSDNELSENEQGDDTDEIIVEEDVVVSDDEHEGDIISDEDSSCEDKREERDAQW